MNPIQLLAIIKNANQLTKAHTDQLKRLHETFPYFQVPKLLLAKEEYNRSKGEEKTMLHWAAITSPDRLRLQNLIEDEDGMSSIIETLGVDFDSELAKQSQSNPSNFIDDLEDPDIPAEYKKKPEGDRVDILKKLGEDLGKSKEENKSTIEYKSKTDLSDPEKPIATVENLEEETTKKPLRKKRKAPADDLIESIRRKEKKEILDDKKKEQIDLIKSFSKRDIKLATIKEIEKHQKQTDLSELSTKLNANLLSETYAQLLVKQGKRYKAKEIYKRLMVKFPDKSAYFADLIKELEENKS